MRIKVNLLTFLLTAGIILSACAFGPRTIFAEEASTQGADIKKSKNDLIQAGKLYYRTHKYEAAIQQWEEALSLDPENKKIKKFIKKAQKKLDSQRAHAEEAKRRFEEKARNETEPKARTEPRKRKWWFANWFQKETGVISVGAPSKEAVGVYSLDDCVKIAITNHIPLHVAEKSIKLAEMRLLEARRNMLPTATIAFEESTGEVQARQYSGRKQYIEGQQPVFHGGELYYTMKQAETNLEVVRNDYKKIKNELILQVKKAYYALTKAEENLVMQEALAGEVTKINDMVNKGYEAGVISKIEHLNVGAQASQVRYQLASAEGDASTAELILKQAMNIDMKQAIEIDMDLDFKKVEIDFDNVLHLAMLNRPEIKISTLMVDYYNYGKWIARAKGFPKIDIIGNWGLAKEEYDPQDQSASDPDRKLEQQWYAVVKASMPFWGSTAEYSWTKEEWVPVVSAYQGTEATTNSYKLKVLDKLDYYSDKQLSEIDFDNARQDLNKKRQDITLETKEACFNYQKALIQLETATNKVKYQEKDLEFTKLKRGMDEVQDSNVIEGMIKLAQEKFGYVQALTDCHTSLASINKAIGIADYFKDEKVIK